MADTRETTTLSDILRAKPELTVWAKAPDLVEPHSTAPSLLWARAVPRTKSLRVLEWYIQCTFVGNKLLEESIDIDPERRGGRAVLRGTGFTVSQTLIELADSSGVKEVAENFDLDQTMIAAMLNGLAMLLSKPFAK